MSVNSGDEVTLARPAEISILGIMGQQAESFAEDLLQSLAAPLRNRFEARRVGEGSMEITLLPEDFPPTASVALTNATYLSYQFFGHPEMRLRLRK